MKINSNIYFIDVLLPLALPKSYTFIDNCLISAVMTIGANIQWGYAGLINFGIMGYTALGGLAVVLVSVEPVKKAWQVGGLNILACIWIIVAIIFVVKFILKRFDKSKLRNYSVASVILGGIILLRVTAAPGIEAIESVDPAKTGYLWSSSHFDSWSLRNRIRDV